MIVALANTSERRGERERVPGARTNSAGAVAAPANRDRFAGMRFRRACPRVAASVASLFTCWLAAGAVELGASREVVLRELGPPDGAAIADAREILFYPRGKIAIEDGRVVSSEIISPEAFARQQTREAAEAADRARRVAERNARLEAEGRAIVAARETDPAFLTLPASEQLRLWREFSARYPMIPAHEKIAALADRAAREGELRLIASAQQSRIDALEARVDAAEQRAARARQEARRSRSGGIGYPLFGYGWRDVKHHRGHDRGRPSASPPAHPMDAARGEAMGAYEDARSAIYSQSGF